MWLYSTIDRTISADEGGRPGKDEKPHFIGPRKKWEGGLARHEAFDQRTSRGYAGEHLVDMLDDGTTWRRTENSSIRRVRGGEEHQH